MVARWDINVSSGGRIVRRRAGLTAIAIALVGATLVGGCAQIASVPLALADSLTVVSWVSTAVSGKRLGEHALDFVTGKDCRFLDAALRADRDLCEPPGSPATEDDFEGLAGLFDRDKAAVSATAALPLQPASFQAAEQIWPQAR